MFRKEQKIEVAKKVVEKSVASVESIKDTLLGVDVNRYKLFLAGEYIGRDAVLITPIGELEDYKNGKIKNISNADVRHISESYKLISNEEVKESLTEDIEDIFIETEFISKKESFTDFSGLFSFQDEEHENIILFRNSYIPGRSLSILLGVKDKVIVPLMSVSYIHTEKNLKIHLEEEIEKISEHHKIIDVLKTLEPIEADLQSLKLIVEKSVRWDKNGNRIEKVRKTGEELLEIALKQDTYWEAIQMLVFHGYKRPYTVKRKVDKFVIGLFDWLTKGKPIEQEEIIAPFAF